MTLSRRALLQASVLAPFAGACARPRTRRDVLSALVLELATDDARALVGTSSRLAESLRVAVAAPPPAALETARAAWKAALLAWRRAGCFQTVPLVKSNALLRATFFPVKAPAVEQLALSGTTNTDQSVNELGVDRKGLFALEVLLFGAPGTTALPLVERTDAEGTHVRRLAHLLGSNVAEYARTAARALGDGREYARTYADGGQENVNRLVSQMLGTIGSITSGRLSRALVPGPASKPSQIEGFSSGTTLDIVSTLVQSVERVYLGGPGGGLAELVRASSAPIDAHVRAAFGVARSKLDDARRAGAADRERASTVAHEAVRALDRALESELASALGVTLLFAGPDAD